MITEHEIETLRQHLGYGALGLDAAPYSTDGFCGLFHDIIGPNLTTGAETQAAFAIAAGRSAVTPDSMTDIVTGARLVIDVADDSEIVTVRSATPTTFTATFTKAHPVNTPICLLSGVARLRLTLHRADQAWQAMQDPSIGATAGLQSVDRGDVVWFAGFRVLSDRLRHYQAIQSELSSLVRVPVCGAGSSLRLSVY
jgi:hypothetical protein